MMDGRGAAWLGVALALGGCGGGDYIIAGRHLDPCLENLPACTRASASCVLDPATYAEQRFPGVFSFLVDVDAGNELEVLIFFAEQNDAGQQTQIVWNEPGCSDQTVYNSGGADLFYEARDVGVLSRKAEIKEDGEHLLEIDSDMRALTLITVEIVVPGTR
jgi:hypothetical protein